MTTIKTIIAVWSKEKEKKHIKGNNKRKRKKLINIIGLERQEKATKRKKKGKKRRANGVIRKKIPINSPPKLSKKFL